MGDGVLGLELVVQAESGQAVLVCNNWDKQGSAFCCLYSIPLVIGWPRSSTPVSV